MQPPLDPDHPKRRCRLFANSLKSKKTLSTTHGSWRFLSISADQSCIDLSFSDWRQRPLSFDEQFVLFFYRNVEITVRLGKGQVVGRIQKPMILSCESMLFPEYFERFCSDWCRWSAWVPCSSNCSQEMLVHSWCSRRVPIYQQLDFFRRVCEVHSAWKHLGPILLDTQQHIFSRSGFETITIR